MKNLFFGLSLWLAVGTLAVSQPAQQPPAWDVSLAQNTTARSNLTVVNQCRKKHDFEVQGQNVPFLQISQNRVPVNGGQTVNVPVQFNTQNLPLGVHRGQVLVICLTCRSEPTCSQDREVLQVVLQVTPPPNQPANQPTNQPQQSPQNNPPTNQSPPTTALYQSQTRPWFLEALPSLIGNKNPCDSIEKDCDELKRIAWEKEAAAATAQKMADKINERAAQAEKKAKELEEAAKRAENSIAAERPTTAVVDGAGYTTADSEHLVKLRKENEEAYRAGKINEAEYQRRANELTTQKAREERLAQQEKLKKEAAEKRKEADQARAAAAEAKAAASDAQKQADEARREAEKARQEYEDCVKKSEAECQRLKAEQERQEKAQKDIEVKTAAAAKQKQEAEKNRKDAEAARLAHQKYLLDNIKKLGLISSAPFKDMPGAFDAVIEKLIPDILGKSVEDWVKFMTEQGAEAISNSPIPISTIQALGGLYQVVAKLLDPCSPLGSPRIVERLQGMTNPKTGRRYTLSEALQKTDDMCKLLRELKAKLEAIKKLHAQKTR
jgi:hypothetical protein